MDKNGGSFAIIAKTRLTQQVGMFDKARKSQMIHKSDSEPPVNTTPNQLMSRVTHVNGIVSLCDIGADASKESLLPAKALSGVEGCQQLSLSDVASQILSCLPVLKKEGRGYLDRLRSDLKGLCDQTCMTPQPRQSQSPETQAPGDSNSQRPCPDNAQPPHAKKMTINLESPIEAMEVDTSSNDVVMPEDRGKSELARLFGEFGVNTHDRDRLPSQHHPEKQEYPGSQLNSNGLSQVDGTNVSANSHDTTLNDRLRDVMPPDHIKDLLDLLDDPLTWSTSSASAHEMFDYGVASSDWTLQRVKPLSLTVDSPSPVKLYPRRLY
jgi:hypothetical protein